MATKKNDDSAGWPAPLAPLAHTDSDLDADTMSETDLREQLKSARRRVAALETIKVGGPGRLTHHHDIERFWRLGMLTPEQIVGFQETGQLPKPPVDAAEAAAAVAK